MQGASAFGTCFKAEEFDAKCEQSLFGLRLEVDDLRLDQDRFFAGQGGELQSDKLVAGKIIGQCRVDGQIGAAGGQVQQFALPV